MVLNTLWNLWHGFQHSFQHGSYHRWISCLNVLKTSWKSMLKISEHVEICNACWKSVLKSVMHVENYVESMLKISVRVKICNACWKLCWKLGLFVCNSCIMCMLWKTLLCWKSMLKISACVEICNACWKLCWNEEKIGPVCMQLLHNVHAMENLAVLKKHVENFSACWCNGFEITFVSEKHVVEDNILFTNHLVGK